MMPGMNPRKMNQMMKKMGIKQQELDATEVIIRMEDSELVIENPQVSKVNMMGQKTFQIVGEAVERPRSDGSSAPEISDEDVQTVVDQTEVDADTARAAIEDANGDLAEAILKLQEN